MFRSKETVTQKDMLKALFQDYNGRFLPKKYLVNPDRMVEGEDFNDDYLEEEARWLCCYLRFLHDEIQGYKKELDEVADYNYNLFEQHLESNLRGVKIERANPIPKEEFLGKVRDIGKRAPKIDDDSVDNSKDILDALFGAEIMANMVFIATRLLGVAYAKGVMYAKK